jgi:glyceraldehyde-3-phosphate dehydrogenase/erythrose-4-phosphate dehydrogenase
VVDLTVKLAKETTYDEIMAVLKKLLKTNERNSWLYRR